MEQITEEVVMRFIKTNHIALKPTQDKICLPIVNRLYRKMSNNIKFPDIKAADGLIIDGHHRYLAAALCKYQLDHAPSETTSATNVLEWEAITWVNDDWDTPAEIDHYNTQDAAYNNMSIDEIIILLK